MKIRFRSLAILTLLLTATAGVMRGDTAAPVDHPGWLGRGVTLLANGWKIAPVGWHVPVSDLPLAVTQSPDGRFVLVSNNGYAKPTITVFDEEHETVVQRFTLDHAWVGMAWHPDGRLFVSGAGNTTVHELTFTNGRLKLTGDLVLGKPMSSPGEGANRPEPVPQSFVGGIAVSPSGDRLFAVHVLGMKISVVDLKTRQVVKTVDLPAEPYTCIVSPDGSTLFVSLWGGAKVLMFDAKTLAASGEVAVGEHPNAMAVSRDGKRLFVACANTNAVWAIELGARRAVEQISLALYPNTPPGSTPNSASLSPDGKRLIVANADNNTLAVIDVETPGKSHVEGFIPTGWYPTGAIFSADGTRIFVLSGKGLSSGPNPRGSQAGVTTGADGQYSGSMFSGTLSIVGTPSADGLATMTATVRSLTPLSDTVALAPANAPAGSPIPRRVGDPSPIKYVYYIIRENRSYDQVFGDIEGAEGDPELCLFGDRVTPNAHALEREFGVFDNFYVNAEVSYDGHAYSTGAYATDLVEKFWPVNYASRGAAYLSEGGGANRNAYGNVAAPMNGYIWDACTRKNVSVHSWGEFVNVGAEKKLVASVPGLEGRISLKYAPWDLHVPDGQRADVFIAELHDLEASGKLPALSIIRMGNDHTGGTSREYPTPRAMIAENDLAIGRVVEAISHSAHWNESAIFILEDDAQNGPDHVDAHRSPAIVVSPFSRRRQVDNTMYTTSGMLRTMELILGLPPMSQYDAAATPMYNAFQATPIPTPFTHLEARIALDERNDRAAFGADESRRMNFAEADLIPEQLFNEILWRSVKGPASPMPPIVRRAWVREAQGADADDR